MVSSARPYRSKLREQQAEETRQRVLRSARELFERQGYAATTIAQVAAEAGVSAQTIYAVFSSKSGLALALIDYTNAQSGAPELALEVAAATAPRDILRASLHLICVLHERIGGFIEVLLEASRVDESLAPAVAAGRASHRGPQRSIAERLQRSGALRPDVGVDEATDILSVWTSPEIIGRYVGDLHWTYEQVEESLTSALLRALCTPAAARRGAHRAAGR